MQDENYTAEELALADAILDAMPRTRAECPTDGPCPWVTCRYSAWTDVTQYGRLVQSPAWGNEAVTCILRIADENPDGMTFEAVGAVLGLTRERISQIEEQALYRLRDPARQHGLDDYTPQEQQDISDLGADDA